MCMVSNKMCGDKDIYIRFDIQGDPEAATQPRGTGYCKCEAIARLAEAPDNAKWRQCPLQPALLVGESGSPLRGERRHSHVCTGTYYPTSTYNAV